MNREFRRYESGMMLPPANEEQRWIEAQRIMADMIDQSLNDQQSAPGSQIAYVDGTWVNDQQQENDFTLERYMGMSDGRLHTTFMLTVDDNDAEQKIYCIDPVDAIDVRSDDESAENLLQRRAEVCRILASAMVDISINGMHYAFERLITEAAVQESPFLITGAMMNWDPIVWDNFVEEYRQKRKVHSDSRINPIYLVPGALNSQYQRQLEAGIKKLS